MRFTAQEEFGLRCMVQMARQGTTGFINIVEVAQREALSAAHVAKVMRALRQAGLIKSIRGQKGGYELARQPQEIVLAELIAAIGGRLYSPEFCTRYSGLAESCVHDSNCSIRAVWSGVDELVHNYLAGLTLADLVCREDEMREKLPAPLVQIGGTPKS